MVEEINRLERILDVWDGPAKAKPRATSSTATRTNGNTGTRAGRGQRPAQFLEAVKDSPGITANDLAAGMECNINYVYRLAKDLDDQIEKRGKGFHPKGYVEDDTVSRRIRRTRQRSPPTMRSRSPAVLPTRSLPSSKPTPALAFPPLLVRPATR